MQHSVASATAGIEDNSEKIVTLEQRRKQLNEQVDARSEQLVESVALLQKDSGLRLFLRAYFEPSPIVAALFILDHQASAAAVVVEW